MYHRKYMDSRYRGHQGSAKYLKHSSEPLKSEFYTAVVTLVEVNPFTLGWTRKENKKRHF